MFVITIILAVLLAPAYLASGGGKIAGAGFAMEGADHLGFSHQMYRVIGVFEILGAIGLLVGLGVSWLGVAAGVGIVILMILAIVFHLRAGDKAAQFGPALILAIVAILEVIFRAASA